MPEIPVTFLSEWCGWHGLVRCRAMTEAAEITRFAPSPTGRLHVGNARTALFNSLIARHSRGELILRIEDTDAERSQLQHEEALAHDLLWLGVEWQQGPRKGGPHAPYRQSERTEIYRRYYAELETEDAVYPCFCSAESLKLVRKSQMAAGQPPRYPGTCARLPKAEAEARLAKGEAATLRFRVPEAREIVFEDLVFGEQRFRSEDIGDFIIRRADGTPAFFFSNAIDDALMGVTLALRGVDHLTNTPRQLLLLEALGLRAPRYGHFALVQDSEGGGLSKRLGSLGLADLRALGYLPLALANYLARLGHSYANEGFKTIEQLVEEFDIQRFGRAPARYDQAQLDHWQKEAVLRLNDGEMLDWLLAHEARSEITARVPAEERAHFVLTVRDNIVMPVDAAKLARALYEEKDFHASDAVDVIRETDAAFFEQALAALDAAENFRDFAKSVGAAAGVKGKSLFMPLRAAITGMTHGPEMVRVWELLGKTRIRTRLAIAIAVSRT